MCEITAKRVDDLLEFVKMTESEFAGDIRDELERGVRAFVEGYILGLNNASP